MKILIVNTFYYPNEMGGAENSCRVLAESMVREGHEVSVVSTTGEKSHQATLNGVSLFYIKLFNVFWHGSPGRKGILRGVLWHLLDMFNPLMAYRFYKVLNEVRPDVVHTNNLVGFSCSVWWVCKLLKIPVVHTLRDYYLKCFRSNMRKNGDNCPTQCASCKCLTFARKRLSRSVDTCVGNSQFMVDSHLGAGYFDPKKKQQVIYNAWAPDYDVEEHHKYKLAAGSQNIFGFIGRIAEEKGVELLCDAFLQVLGSRSWSEGKKPLLKIAGSGEDDYVNYLKDRYQNERIVFLGKVKAEEFYSKIDFVVVPSLWEEPLARVVFEAFFFSVPVITSDKGGSPEAVKDKWDGFVFSDREGLVKIMTDLSLSGSADTFLRAYTSRCEFEVSGLIDKYALAYFNSSSS